MSSTSTNVNTHSSKSIPVILLKTRSQPHDTYEDHFSKLSFQSTKDESLDFKPQFVPVLTHESNQTNLSAIETLLKSGTLDDKYGGLIFTSQRAVEAFAEVVKRVDMSQPSIATSDNKSNSFNCSTDFPFPIYVVGPATAKSIQNLISQASSDSPLRSLNANVQGSNTGNGEQLAKYILFHYNLSHSHRVYTFYEAPRLPFVPWLGPSRGERIDIQDERLNKKPLLFLVGEVRRDIIPRTLMEDKERSIEVEELEVYSTSLQHDFESMFYQSIERERKNRSKLVVIVVFSPQGSEAMLRSLGYMREDGQLTQLARSRWDEDTTATKDEEVKYVIATIGPTTRDHLKQKFGFEADVCASSPSPDGLGQVLLEFLTERKTYGWYAPEPEGRSYSGKRTFPLRPRT